MFAHAVIDGTCDLSNYKTAPYGGPAAERGWHSLEVI